MSSEEDYLTTRAAESLAALLEMCRHLTTHGRDIPPAAVGLARALHGRSILTEAVSPTRNTAAVVETIDDVRSYGTPAEAGTAVGLSGRRVQQLCAAGLITHRRVGRRYLVDVADLQRHLRDAS